MKKQKVLFWLILLALSVFELILAWRVKGFADFYVNKIFPVFQVTYGRLSGLFRFSLGELLLYASIAFLAFTIIIWICRFVNFVNRKEALKKLSLFNTKFLCKLLVFIALVQIQNCFVLYQQTPLFENTAAASYQPNREDLMDLRETLVKRANELCDVFERNKKGEIIYDADFNSLAMIAMADLGENAKKRIEDGNPQILDESLKRLAGYYSTPKPMLKSDFLCQQRICGYYFPFTIEANYNDLMYIANYPDTMCHELSHLKGFILEDEAGFLAYLGCMNSDDTLFIYSATVQALCYVDLDLKRDLALEPEMRKELTPIDERVAFDSMFITADTQKMVDDKAWFKSENVEKATDAFLDKNLTINGVEEGIDSYSGIVDLLLKYYYGGKDNG